jgi:hypothetical protein
VSGITLTGGEQVLELHNRIIRVITRVPQGVREVNRGWVPKLRMMLVEASSGRPGPEVITGAYNAAYVVELVDDGMGVGADNPSPQSNRLEYGFVGQDSLGRNYHQPPFPHFRPTFDKAGPLYTKEISEVFPKWW